MHDMQITAIDDPDVCESVTRAGCAKTAEQVDVLLGVATPGDSRNIVLVLGGSPCYPRRRYLVTEEMRTAHVIFQIKRS